MQICFVYLLLFKAKRFLSIIHTRLPCGPHALAQGHIQGWAGDSLPPVVGPWDSGQLKRCAEATLCPVQESLSPPVVTLSPFHNLLKTSGEGKSKKKKKIHDQHHQMEVDINLPHMQKKNYFLLR